MKTSIKTITCAVFAGSLEEDPALEHKAKPPVFAGSLEEDPALEHKAKPPVFAGSLEEDPALANNGLNLITLTF